MPGLWTSLQGLIWVLVLVGVLVLGVPTLGQFSLPGSALQVGRYRGEREREEERKEEGGRERKREGGRERGREGEKGRMREGEKGRG